MQVIISHGLPPPLPPNESRKRDEREREKERERERREEPLSCNTPGTRWPGSGAITFVD